MSVTKDLLQNYQNVIEDLRLHTGDKGVFDVAVNGHVLYSKAETGRHVEDGEVLRLFTEHVGADVPRFPRG